MNNRLTLFFCINDTIKQKHLGVFHSGHKHFCKLIEIVDHFDYGAKHRKRTPSTVSVFYFLYLFRV